MKRVQVGLGILLLVMPFVIVVTATVYTLMLPVLLVCHHFSEGESPSKDGRLGAAVPTPDAPWKRHLFSACSTCEIAC